MSDNLQYPISWDESKTCGCVEHVTDVGNGFRISRDYCFYHKQQLELRK